MIDSYRVLPYFLERKLFNDHRLPFQTILSEAQNISNLNQSWRSRYKSEKFIAFVFLRLYEILVQNVSSMLALIL